jgi:uncharacterized protein
MTNTLTRRPAILVRAAVAALAGLAAVWSSGIALASAEASLPPAPTRWVTDTAGFLSREAASQLDARLAAVQKQSGHQLVVWIGRTIRGAALDDWAARTFAAWKIGRKGIDDGLVMFVLADDRTVAIEVGYGLEGQVSDAVASRVIREVMTPRLRAGDRDGAVIGGIDALLQALDLAKIQPATSEVGPAPTHGLPSWPKLILYGLLGLGFLLLLVTHPRLALFFLWNILSGGRGGGGDGFSGGGGRSGGGGSRGSW